ncbi:DNA-binding protein H-NS [Allgaiera indica]|nr:DNA-binding protein H-NS [Allgaiera indica]
MKDLEKMSADELKKLMKDAEKQLAAAEARKKADTKAAIQKILDEAGYDIGDLFSGATGGKSKKSGSKGEPRYRDPETGSTWTGRGRKPKWLLEAESAGRSVEDFAI